MNLASASAQRTCSCPSASRTTKCWPRQLAAVIPESAWDFSQLSAVGTMLGLGVMTGVDWRGSGRDPFSAAFGRHPAGPLSEVQAPSVPGVAVRLMLDSDGEAWKIGEAASVL